MQIEEKDILLGPRWITASENCSNCSPYGQFFARGGGKPFAQKIISSCPNFYEKVVYEKKRGPYFAEQHRAYWHMMVARYSFSGSIPSKFERKLCRHKQTVRKVTTSCIRYSPMKFVMIRVAMTSDRSCYNNKMTPLPTAVTCSNIFWHWELFLQNRSRELFFSNTVASMLVKLKRNL